REIRLMDRGDIRPDEHFPRLITISWKSSRHESLLNQSHCTLFMGVSNGFWADSKRFISAWGNRKKRSVQASGAVYRLSSKPTLSTHAQARGKPSNAKSRRHACLAGVKPAQDARPQNGACAPKPLQSPPGRSALKDRAANWRPGASRARHAHTQFPGTGRYPADG